ncbi:MAG: molybdenum cofactor guanylyltransferase [Candidatus Latescibacterota bacterium]|nr:MAG: molybdenum cofactor guanylyltransferase [Candidatus Latescibacterota bacterium]
MASPYKDITGFVLAGGSSRRLGTDKRKIVIGGISLLDRARSLLERFLERPAYIVGDNLAGLYLDPRYEIPDAQRGRGPMGGLVAAITRCPTNWCLILPVDLPRLRTSDLQNLANNRSSAFDVVTLSRDGHPEPLAALYNVRTAAFWRDQLDSGMLSVIDAIRTLRWRPVMLGRSATSLDSVNTPEDLARVVDL